MFLSWCYAIGFCQTLAKFVEFVFHCVNSVLVLSSLNVLHAPQREWKQKSEASISGNPAAVNTGKWRPTSILHHSCDHFDIIPSNSSINPFYHILQELLELPGPYSLTRQLVGLSCQNMKSILEWIKVQSVVLSFHEAHTQVRIFPIHVNSAENHYTQTTRFNKFWLSETCSLFVLRTLFFLLSTFWCPKEDLHHQNHKMFPIRSAFSLDPFARLFSFSSCNSEQSRRT